RRLVHSRLGSRLLTRQQAHAIRIGRTGRRVRLPLVPPPAPERPVVAVQRPRPRSASVYLALDRGSACGMASRCGGAEPASRGGECAMLPDQAVPDPGTGQRPDPQASRQRRADSDTSGVPRPDRLPGETAVPEAPTVVAPTMVADDGVPGPPRGGRGPGPWLIAALAGVLVLGLAAMSQGPGP